MWPIKFYTTSSGKSPIESFLDKLTLIQQSKIRNGLRLLEEFGPQLRQPYSKKLTGSKNLFEIRTMGKSPIRLIYAIKSNTFYILHAFIKKTKKTPTRDIKIAIQRLSTLT
jgi:phage-related protein